MTVDREQVRRDESVSREWRGLGHRAVTEGVNLRYVEQMRKALYAAADEYDALLAELEQAERERDAVRELDEHKEWERAEMWRAKANELNARLAAVPALVEALRDVVRYFASYGLPPAGFPLGNCQRALAAYEQAQEQR